MSRPGHRVVRHVGGVDDLTSSDVAWILQRAGSLEDGDGPRVSPGLLLTLAFYAPSTRTRVGFAAAAVRLGMGAVDVSSDRDADAMSAAESFADTIRVVSAYSAGIVLRHPSPDAWHAATAVAQCPVINGGIGEDEHPTQALIDLHAIERRHGRLDGLKIGLVGDLRGSRAAHSLLRLLSSRGPGEIRLMGPESSVDAGVVERWTAGLPAGCARVRHTFSAEGLDVLYMAGLPAHTTSGAYGPEERARFSLTVARVAELPSTAIVLSPLPRVDEIAPEVDADPRAGYFAQSDLGIWVRIALLEFLRPGSYRGHDE